MKTHISILTILAFILVAFPASAQPLRQNPWTTNATRAAFDAQGNDIRNLFKVGLTNGWLIVETNSQRTAGGGTNEITGVASLMVGRVGSTNGNNRLTGTASLLVGTASGSASTFSTNQITATGGGNAMFASQANQSISGGFLNSIEGSGGGNVMVVGDAGTLGNAYGRRVISGSSYANIVALSGTKGSWELPGINGLIFAGNSGGNVLTNRVQGNASVVAMYGGTNYFNSLGTVGAMFASSGSQNELVSTVGGLAFMYSNGSTNLMHGSGIYGVAAYLGGTGRMGPSGIGSFLGGYVAENTNTITVISGNGAFLWSSTSGTYNSAAVQGDGAFMVGSGYTNSYPYRLMFGYGSGPRGAGPAFTVSTNHAVGVATNNPQASLDVNGSAQSHFGFLSLLTSQTLAVAATTYTQITNYQASQVYGFGSEGTGNTGGSLTNTVAGYYKIAFQISFTGGNNDAYEIGVFTNLTECTLIEAERTMGAAAAIGSASAVGIVYLPALTRIDLRIQNATDADDPTLERVQLVVGHP